MYYLLPLAMEQKRSNDQSKHSTRTWLCWIVLDDLIKHYHNIWAEQKKYRLPKINERMEQLSHGGQHSHTSATATNMLPYEKVLLQIFALKRKGQKS